MKRGCMNEKKLLSIISLALCPVLLMSAVNDTMVYSTIMKEDIPALERLSEGSKTITIYGHKSNDVAATLTLNYELFKMDKTTKLYTDYLPVYSLVYEVIIYLNSSVNYKGGVFDMFDGCHPAYLDEIRLSIDFDGVSNARKASQFPDDNVSNLTSLYTIPFTNPELYPNGLDTNDFNDIELLDSGSGFKTSYGIKSLSYGLPVSDLNHGHYDNVLDEILYLMDLGDDRIWAKLFTSTDTKNNDSTINFTTSLEYGYDFYLTEAGNIEAKKANYFSGPASIDDDPFNFHFFGATNVELESNTKPSNVDMTVSLTSTHGSSVWLDSFTETASMFIDIL